MGSSAVMALYLLNKPKTSDKQLEVRDICKSCDDPLSPELAQLVEEYNNSFNKVKQFFNDVMAGARNISTSSLNLLNVMTGDKLVLDNYLTDYFKIRNKIENYVSTNKQKLPTIIEEGDLFIRKFINWSEPESDMKWWREYHSDIAKSCPPTGIWKT